MGMAAEANGPWYKVLVDGRSAFADDLAWPLPRAFPGGGWEPGDWVEVEGPLELTVRGIHLTDAPFRRWVTWGMRVYEAEPDGIAARERDLALTGRCRLLRPVPNPGWWAAERFVAEEVRAARWFDPDGEPDPDWRLVTAPTWGGANEAAWAVVGSVAALSAQDRPYAEAMIEVHRMVAAHGRRMAAEVLEGHVRLVLEAPLDAAVDRVWDDTPDGEQWAAPETARDNTEFAADAAVALALVADCRSMRQVGS